MKHNEKGFTLIELIVVIAIVGIMAAIALPRYIDAQRDARVAKLLALNGSIRAASSLAHARCLLDQAANPVGTCTAAGGTANMEGLAIAMINGYPQANNAGTGIIAAAQLNAGADALTISAGGAGAGVAITIDIIGATAPATCRISYTSSAAAGSAPIIAVPLTAGC